MEQLCNVLVGHCVTNSGHCEKVIGNISRFIVSANRTRFSLVQGRISRVGIYQTLEIQMRHFHKIRMKEEGYRNKYFNIDFCRKVVKLKRNEMMKIVYFIGEPVENHHVHLHTFD